MKIVNAKGEPFDATGATVVDLAPFFAKKIWGRGPEWKEGVEKIHVPVKEKAVIRSVFSKWKDMELPCHISRVLQSRLRKNAEKFMVEVGFEVPDTFSDKNTIVICLSPYEIDYAYALLKKRRAKEALDKKIDDGNVTESKPCQLLVPDVGTVLRLAADWTFTLHLEYRNKSLIQGLGLPPEDEWKYIRDNKEPPKWKVTLQKGSVLTIDRIYLRKGAGEFSSFTFLVRSEPVATAVLGGKEFKLAGKFRMPGSAGAVRFWAKLEDVNTMSCVFIMETMKVKKA